MSVHAKRSSALATTASKTDATPSMEDLLARAMEAQQALLEDLRVPGKKPDHAGAWVDEKDHETIANAHETIANAHAIAEAAVLVLTKDKTNDEQGRWQFLNTLDRVDDPTTRHKMISRYEEMTGQSLEGFISKADWASGRDKEQALDLISSKRDAAHQKLVSLSPDEREKVEDKAEKDAAKVIEATRSGKTDDDEIARSIFRILGDREPHEVEAIRAAIRANTGDKSIYQEIDRSMSGANEDEALAGLKGDPIHSASMGLINARGDAERTQEILRGLSPAQLDTLRSRNPLMSNEWISGAVPESQRPEVEALLARTATGGDETDQKAAADGAHFAELFADPTKDLKTTSMLDTQKMKDLQSHQSASIIEELRSKTPEQIKAARSAWEASHPGQSWEALIEDRFGSDVNATLRLRALANGDRTGERAFALRQAMRENDQAAIEAVLASPDLNSEDALQRAVAHAERLALTSRVQELDTASERAIAMTEGRDASKVHGRTLQQQLAAARGGTPEVRDVSGALDVIKGPEAQQAKRRDDEIATADLLEHGELSLATKIRRAQKAGDAKQESELLDGIQTKEELAALKKQFETNYGQNLFKTADTDRFAAFSRMVTGGDDAEVEAFSAELAYKTQTMHQRRVSHTETYGVRAERAPALQFVLQKELNDLSESESLDSSEARRAAMGGNVGTSDIVRTSEQRMERQFDPTWDGTSGKPRELREGVSKEDFQRADRSMTTFQDAQNAAKIEHAEQLGNAFMTVAKLGALLSGNPALFMALDAVATAGGMAIKSSIAGSDYDATNDFQQGVIGGVSNFATLGLTKYVSSALKSGAKATTLANVEMLGSAGIQLGGTMAAGALTDQSTGEMAFNGLRSIGGAFLPAFLGKNAASFIKGSSGASSAARTGVDFVTRGATTYAMNGGGGAQGMFEAAVGAAGDTAQAHTHGGRTTADLDRHPFAHFADDDRPVVYGPEIHGPPTPKDWAAEQQRIANERPKMTAEQLRAKAEIDELSARAKTADDWNEIRAREDKHDLPVSVRTSPHDELALIDAQKRRGEEPHEDAIVATKRQVAARSQQHADNVEQVRRDAEAEYRARDKQFFDEKVRTNDTIKVESATVGLGLSGTAGANANPRTGTFDENGMPRNLGIGNAKKDELWKNMPAQEPIGQPAKDLDNGLPNIARVAEHPTAQNARAGEAAAAVAINRARSGITSIEADGPLTPFELPNAVRDENGNLVALGPIVTTARVKVGEDKFGLPVYETKRIEINGDVDFAGGMGPPRELDPDLHLKDGTIVRKQITPEDADVLKGDAAVRAAGDDLQRGRISRHEYDGIVARAHRERAMLSAEDSLGMAPSVFAGQTVLVIGGGPTAQWAGDHVTTNGSKVEIAARMPKPDPRSPLGLEIEAKEALIRKRLADPARTTAEMERLKQEHHRLVARHISEQKKLAASLQDKLDANQLPPSEATAAREELERVQNDLDPFRGSRLDRNDASLNRTDIDRFQMNIDRVELVDGPEGPRNRVTYADGTQKTYDRVIPGIGADAESDGGVSKMLSQLPREVRLLPVIENGRPVALASDPPGVWITGAAAVGTIGIPPRDVMKRIPLEMQAAYRDAVREWANRPEVSHGSRDVTPGIENVGDNAALLQDAKARSPEEREELRAEWLRSRTEGARTR